MEFNENQTTMGYRNVSTSLIMKIASIPYEDDNLIRFNFMWGYVMAEVIISKADFTSVPNLGKGDLVQVTGKSEARPHEDITQNIVITLYAQRIRKLAKENKKLRSEKVSRSRVTTKAQEEDIDSLEVRLERLEL